MKVDNRSQWLFEFLSSYRVKIYPWEQNVSCCKGPIAGFVINMKRSRDLESVWVRTSAQEVLFGIVAGEVCGGVIVPVACCFFVLGQVVDDGCMFIHLLCNSCLKVSENGETKVDAFVEGEAQKKKENKKTAVTLEDDRSLLRKRQFGFFGFVFFFSVLLLGLLLSLGDVQRDSLPELCMSFLFQWNKERF